MSEASFFEWGTPAFPVRHALLRVGPQAYRLALDARPDLASETLLFDWAALSRPLIARRRGPRDVAGLTPAGIPLPPSHGKKRIALQLAPGAILAVEPPPLLAVCAHAAPAAWLPAIEAIVELGARAGVEVRIFGALAWSALTGLAYLSASSDLDLLLQLTARTNARALLEGLARVEADAPMRLDGELVRQDIGAAANWREFAAGANEVLVKSVAGVALRAADAFLFHDGHQMKTPDWRAAS
jgi:phosphoribosyl-dephospho-CoA transferase